MNMQMLMDMFAGGSQALLKNQPMMSGINPITQQSIQSQSYAKLLQNWLGGGAKMTMDKEKFGITGPSSLLGEQGSNPVASGDPTSGGYGGTPQGQAERSGPQNQGQIMPGQDNINPQALGFLQQLILGGGNPKQAL